jgi:hypothetical protein
MSLVLARNYNVLIDEETGELVFVYGDVAAGKYVVKGPVVQHAIPRDRDGHEVKVTEAGRLHVIYASGLPEFETDAAANGDDTYFDLLTVSKDCTACSVYVETNDAIVSFNGGEGDHFFVDVSAGQIVLTGLDIPKGSIISGKNAVAASDYTNLRVACW